jgi:hypothetical protein
VPEWLKGADCKSAGLRPTKVRILLPPPTDETCGETDGGTDYDTIKIRGNSSVGRASAFQAEGREFESRFPLHKIRVEDRGQEGRSADKRVVCATAHVAQSVEHFLGKEEVTGSNPVMGSKRFGAARPSARRCRTAA